MKINLKIDLTASKPVYIIPESNLGRIAQSVEQRIENPCVPGSIPGATTTYAGVVELVDTPDLGSGAFGVRVRVSPSAPNFSEKRPLL